MNDRHAVLELLLSRVASRGRHVVGWGDGQKQDWSEVRAAGTLASIAEKHAALLAKVPGLPRSFTAFVARFGFVDAEANLAAERMALSLKLGAVSWILEQPATSQIIDAESGEDRACLLIPDYLGDVPGFFLAALLDAPTTPGECLWLYLGGDSGDQEVWITPVGASFDEAAAAALLGVTDALYAPAKRRKAARTALAALPAPDRTLAAQLLNGIEDVLALPLEIAVDSFAAADTTDVVRTRIGELRKVLKAPSDELPFGRKPLGERVEPEVRPKKKATKKRARGR